MFKELFSLDLFKLDKQETVISVSVMRTNRPIVIMLLSNLKMFIVL